MYLFFEFHITHLLNKYKFIDSLVPLGVAVASFVQVKSDLDLFN